jgi:hypothetical protein
VEVIITPDLTEMSIRAGLSGDGRVESEFRIVEEGTANCKFITPPSFEFGIIISCAD